MKLPSEIYNGRLVTDGFGNLLAGEGEHEGMPVAFHEGSYVFIGPDEPSHNERHHLQYADVAGTTDAAEEGQEHHDGVLPDDPHYSEDTESNTRPRMLPDKQAAITTGHTEAWKDGDKS